VSEGWFEEKLFPHVRQTFEITRILFRQRTEHQDLVIFETPTYGRVLALDDIIQVTEKDEFVYHEMMTHVPILAHGRVRRVLIIGGGDGGILREALKHRVERVTMVEIDRGTGEWKVRKVVAVDDCGTRINPMIVEGQIMGGLTEGYGMAAMELITFDDDGNCIGSNFMDYLIPGSWETPKFELGETTTPSPHHPIGAKGVGESPTVGSPAAYVNAVIDALSPYGITNIDMPVTSDKVWAALRSKGVTE